MKEILEMMDDGAILDLEGDFSDMSEDEQLIALINATIGG